MLRSAVSKVMWVGRATVFLVSLAVILAILFGVATTALGASDKPFILGKRNVATQVSKLINKGPGPALNLAVKNGQPPLVVNADSGTATNLDADQLDGKNDTDFYAAGSKVDDSAHADEADHADAADTATNAQNADDATKLGGVAASDYVRSNDPRLSNAQISFDVVNNGTFTAWLIDDPSDYNSGSNANPNLVLMRGMTYRFNVNTFGHPFRIATFNGGPAYNVGVTNNDVQGGTLTFKVPMDAPNTLHYYCLFHPGMNGVISIPS